MSLEIVEARRHHCGVISRKIRRPQADAIVGIGTEVHREIINVFERSSFRRSVLCDGELVAMGGVIGSLLAPHGSVWLALSEDFARNHPLAAAREATRWTKRLLKMKTELSAICLIEDEPSKRLLEFLGFQADSGAATGYQALIYRKAA